MSGHASDSSPDPVAVIPLLEGDFDAPGVFEPSDVVRSADMPSRVVLCFFSEVIDLIAARDDARTVQDLMWAHGRHRIFQIEHRGEPLAVLHPGVGAPLAAGLMEETIALGGQRFVVVGGAGVLVPDVVMGHAVVVNSAVRDEGTSMHYLPASRAVEADPIGVAALEQALERAGVPFLTGRTWTTDAPYRETRSRVDRRLAEGCVTVEMEAAALIAVARFRRVELAHLLYAGDSLADNTWDDRGWATATSVREQLFWLAADACVARWGSE